MCGHTRPYKTKCVRDAADQEVHAIPGRDARCHIYTKTCQHTSLHSSAIWTSLCSCTYVKHTLCTCTTLWFKKAQQSTRALPNRKYTIQLIGTTPEFRKKMQEIIDALSVINWVRLEFILLLMRIQFCSVT